MPVPPLSYRILKASVWLWLLPFAATGAQSVEQVGAFLEATFPFVQTAVDLSAADLPKSEPRSVVVRGILLTPPGGFCVLFDQELLRVAAIWRTPEGGAPLKLASMSQVSYAEPHRKAGNDLPAPAQTPLHMAPPGPGASTRETELHADPRPGSSPREYGRGALPGTLGRFEGVELQEGRAVLRYSIGSTTIREWFDSDKDSLLRHIEVSQHTDPVYLSLAKEETTPWQIEPGIPLARSGLLSVLIRSPGADFQTTKSTLQVRIAPSAKPADIVFSYHTGAQAAEAGATAPLPSPQPRRPARRRWPDILQTTAQLATAERSGLVSDTIPLPVANPWKRRVRPADIAFLNADQAAVATYDGDVWIVKGLGTADLQAVSWERFASGLSEPLSIAAVDGSLQLHTRNGLVRLHDTDGNGEADWYENFSDAWVQSSSSRAFPLDMAVAPDGTTFVSQGGIGMGTPFAGAITQISADGRQSQIISRRAREPYLTLNPDSGLLTSTDQQGNFIPSSVCYLVKPGADFGFGDPHPAQLTPPLVWIPHHEDNSSASQLWVRGREMGPFSGKLLHLSYGNGTPLLVCPDLDAPVPQGAVIPLGLKTEIPLLHARMHPSDRSLFACGFQIYDSRTSKNWGLARIRLSGKPVTAPVDARSCSDGVLISFAAPLDPDSVGQESILAATWKYRRSKEYGSGRFNSAGAPGLDPAPIGQVLLSNDRKTVFVHLPGLAPVMQLEVAHSFRFEGGEKAGGKVYFTIHQPHHADLEAAGFAEVDLSKSVPVMRVSKAEPPTKQRGQELSLSMGCIACHSTDGSTEGKTGPTWKGLFGKDRIFTDGSVESANEFYIRTSILEPEKKIVTGYQPGMASYKGVLTEDQIDSIILYMRSLRE
jgi:cytochrome c2